MSEPIRKPDENPSRVESILSDTIGLSGYEIEAPRSRIEILLLELEELIKEGGGGGGESSNYGTSLSIEMDGNFVMSASLLNRNGEVLGEVQTIDLPLESVVVNGSYDSVNKQVVLTLQNGSAVRFSVADLVDGLQTEITSRNPLDADLVSDSNSTHKFATAAQLAQIQTNKTALDNKADKSTTYTKTEVDTALDSKQNTISDLSTIRSGAALGATAVQPETGKGLSTNDYTDSEKSKLAGIEAQANKTTVDDALSGSSTNPVQNKVVKTALDNKADASTTYTKTEVDTALSGKQNAIDSSHKLSADLVDDTSATNKFATAAELEQIETNKNNISKDEAALGELMDNGAKNLFQIADNAYQNELNGLTATFNADGSVTVTGTMTDTTKNAIVYISPSRTMDYRAFQGCVLSGGLSENERIVLQNSASPYNTIADSQGTGVEITNTIPEKTLLYIYIIKRSTAVNYTFYPMICTKTAWDISHDYQPYAMSNAELTAKEQANENNILYNTNNGVKNVVNFNTNLLTTTTRGITFTDNHNGTINVNGTSTAADAYVQLYNVDSDNLFGFKIGETVVITSTSNTVHLQIVPKIAGGYGVTVYGTKLSPAIYTIPSTFTGFLLRVAVMASGTHVDNEDVGGMICLKSLYDADPTYQPYAMSNAELTAKEQANENNISSLLLNGSGKTGNLNDIAVNEFAVYTNQSTNLPSSDYCFVRTSVNSASPLTSRLQEAFVMSTGVSYVRTMGGGTWHSWLQITNTP